MKFAVMKFALGKNSLYILRTPYTYVFSSKQIQKNPTQSKVALSVPMFSDFIYYFVNN